MKIVINIKDNMKIKDLLLMVEIIYQKLKDFIYLMLLMKEHLMILLNQYSFINKYKYLKN